MSTSYARPEQAVILAGGRGTRLRPLTDLWPKPMVRFHGRPFLEYLLLELKRNGFRRVLILGGYRPQAIVDYFGDGQRLGLSIKYSISPEDYETGARIRSAAGLIEPSFMLLYCDNFWPMPFAAMWQRFRDAQAPAMITVYRNADGYTRSNLKLDSRQCVSVYDKTRVAVELAGVDIGFAIIDKSVLELLPSSNVSFEAEVYPRLVEQGRLAAFLTEHRYYSVGSIDRLPTTEVFLARRPCILLDRDGVLNVGPPKAEYVKSWSEWTWLDGAKQALGLLSRHGYRLIVITNQPGIARGQLTLAMMHDIHRRMADEASAAGGLIEAVYFCPHGWDDGCDCRKPKPGLLYAAQRDFALDLSRCLYIGDDERDEQAAKSAFCPFQPVTLAVSLLEVARSLIVAGPPQISATANIARS